MKDHYDIGVVGFWYGVNYGSLLNGYAVYKILKDLGQKVLMIHKICDNPESDPELIAGHNVNFVKKYYDPNDISKNYKYSDVKELNNLCDSFCAGSDQIWNYNISFFENMYLKFADDNKKLISFATSFGNRTGNIPERAKARIKQLFARFDAISVREKFSEELLKNVYEKDSTTIFEPVFLLDPKVYFTMAKSSSFNPRNKYLLAYILDPTSEKSRIINEYAKALNLKVVNILDGRRFMGDKDVNIDISATHETLNKPGCEEFLNAFINATYVITDSFHGTAFSLIFKKKFVSIANYSRGIDRFKDLLGRLNLIDRLIDEHSSFDSKYLNEIDYKVIEKIIEAEKLKALNWIKKIINQPKIEKTPMSPPSANELPQEVQTLYNNADFKKIRLLASLLKDYGIQHIVLSPGGRDVPLIRIFEYNDHIFRIHRITDERSAAYFGLGLAAQSHRPVACICTSGTAASNYLPAVTEAFYTGIPLILITADRYGIYLNQGEDQTIPQKDIYNGVIKKSITLLEASGKNVDYQHRRDISDCILESTHNGNGPVHINVPIDNIAIGSRVQRQYWQLLPYTYPHILRASFLDGTKNMMRWVDCLRKSNRILIVYGQNIPLNEQQKANIKLFAQKYNCVILTDPISNLNNDFCVEPYNMLYSITQETFNNELAPDILITVGGKRLMNDPLTFKVRNCNKGIRHWSVTPDGKIKDFYFKLTSVIESSQDYFFEWFAKNAGEISNNKEYLNKWLEYTNNYNKPHVLEGFNVQSIIQQFSSKLPDNSLLHIGVGSIFFEIRKHKLKENIESFCNMGTNGIDGNTSTFLGQCAVEKNRLCFLTVGDLSFFYDMNSIWNKEIGNNVRILLINNHGTDLLKGHNLKAVSSNHNTLAEGWVTSTNSFEYISASTLSEFKHKLDYFVSAESEKPIFFEVICD